MKTLIYLFLFLSTLSTAFAQNLIVIVNEENPISSLTADQMRDYFFKKSKHWPNGVPVRFFDRGDNSSARKFFLKDVVHKSNRDVELFWIGQKLYTGHSAPTQINTDSMTVAMVARFPGAISFLSGEFAGAKGVKIIEVTGN